MGIHNLYQCRPDKAMASQMDVRNIRHAAVPVLGPALNGNALARLRRYYAVTYLLQKTYFLDPYDAKTLGIQDHNVHILF